MGPSSRFEYVGFWQRVAVAFLDPIIFSPLIAANFWMSQWAFNQRILWPTAALELATHALRIFFVVRYGGTPAKLVLGMRIVDEDGNYLGISGALLRDILPLAGFFVSLALSVHILSVVPPDLAPLTWREWAHVSEQYGGWWFSVNRVVGFVFIIDVLLVACNARKRALHDFIAGSFVVTKQSYDAVHHSTLEGEVGPPALA